MLLTVELAANDRETPVPSALLLLMFSVPPVRLTTAAEPELSPARFTVPSTILSLPVSDVMLPLRVILPVPVLAAPKVSVLDGMLRAPFTTSDPPDATVHGCDVFTARPMVVPNVCALAALFAMPLAPIVRILPPAKVLPKEKALAPGLNTKPRTERVAVPRSGARLPVVPKATVSPLTLPLGAVPPSQFVAVLKVAVVVVEPTPPHTFSTAWAMGIAAVTARESVK